LNCIKPYCSVTVLSLEFNHSILWKDFNAIITYGLSFDWRIFNCSTT
jgi:hypothetical protein